MEEQISSIERGKSSIRAATPPWKWTCCLKAAGPAGRRCRRGFGAFEAIELRDNDPSAGKGVLAAVKNVNETSRGAARFKCARTAGARPGHDRQTVSTRGAQPTPSWACRWPAPALRRPCSACLLPLPGRGECLPAAGAVYEYSKRRQACRQQCRYPGIHDRPRRGA